MFDNNNFFHEQSRTYNGTEVCMFNSNDLFHEQDTVCRASSEQPLLEYLKHPPLHPSCPYSPNTHLIPSHQHTTQTQIPFHQHPTQTQSLPQQTHPQTCLPSPEIPGRPQPPNDTSKSSVKMLKKQLYASNDTKRSSVKRLQKKPLPTLRRGMRRGSWHTLVI